MRHLKIQQVREHEISRAKDTLLAAFVADPVVRYMWPAAHDYVRAFPRLIDGFGGGAFREDAADVSEDFAGGALWLPPGVPPDAEALGALMEETLSASVRAEMMSVLEQMGEAHPAEKHWHLAFIGVDAAHQGRGVGADLMRDRLAKIDAKGEHSYLESSNPRNVPFYQRHGFEVLHEIRVGSAPPVIPMLRTPRRAALGSSR